MTTNTNTAHHADTLMEQAQVFASAWALVGSRFDNGSELENAEEQKRELRAMIEAALSAAAQPEREPLSDLDLADLHYGEGYAEYVELDVFVDIAREIENYYGITAQKEQG